MSASPESVTQSTQTSSTAQTTTTNAPVERTITQESDFDRLWNKGAFDSPEEAKARAEANKKPEKPVKAAPVVEEQAAETTEQAPAEESETEEQPEQQAETQEKTYESLSDYLKDANIDEEGFLDLPATVKVNGKTDTVPLREAISSYQQQQVHTQKSMALADDRRSFEEQRTQVSQALAQQIEQTKQLLQYAETQALGEYKSIDWNALNQTDPARYAALKIDYDQKVANIRSYLAQIDQTQKEQAKQAQEAQAKRLPEETEKLLSAIPEWRDDKKRTADQKAILEYGKSRGLSDAELTITDHRYVQILHDAARYRALQAAKPQALKQVRAAPQMVKPGARVSRDPKAASLQQARENWARNPRDEDAQAAVFSQFV